MWPSWLGRQIVALKVMGSNPIIHPIYAGMAELADALDLGSSVIDVGVQVLFPAPLLLWVVVKKVEFLGSTFFIAKQQGSRVPSRCEASWKGGLLLRSNKVPGHPPDAKRRGKVGFLLRSNKVPGYPPDAKRRGRVGFLFLNLKKRLL